MFNHVLGSPPQQSVDTHVYEYPQANPSTFRVSRLIRYTDSAGQILGQDPVTHQYLELNARRHIFNIDDPNFNVSYGDILLHMEPPNALDLQWMKNYQGQIALVPKCMLQHFVFPFGLNRSMPLATEGVKLDIAFTNRELFNQNGHQHFDDMTPLLVMKQYIKEEDQTTGTNHVIDVSTNRARGVAHSVLDRPFERPWDVLVYQQELDFNFDNMLRYRGAANSTPGTFPQAGFQNREDWVAANPILPGEKAADDAETRDEIDLEVQTLPQDLRPGQKPAPSPYN